MNMKKIMSTIAAASITISILGGIPVSAYNKYTSGSASGYNDIAMCGSSSRTSYSCTFWGSGASSPAYWGCDGTSKTFWYGINPYNLTSITHRDIVCCSGIGTLSVGLSPSGPSATSAVSGHSVTYTYKVENAYYINVDMHYVHYGMVVAWGPYMYTHATLQDGSNFYNVYS